MHRLLVEGVAVEYQRPDGSIGGDLVRVIDFDHPENNDWLAVNQFTVVEGQHNRRPDIVLFVNGLPLAVIELKNAADEDATIWTAFNQLQTYKQQIPSLFAFNEALVISDGVQARIGTLTADRERFMPWRTIEGEELAPTSTAAACRWCSKGVFEKRRFLDLHPALHRLRGRRRRRAHQEDGRLPPVPRRRTWPWKRPSTASRRRRATGASASSGTRKARARA